MENHGEKSGESEESGRIKEKKVENHKEKSGESGRIREKQGEKSGESRRKEWRITEKRVETQDSGPKTGHSTKRN